MLHRYLRGSGSVCGLDSKHDSGVHRAEKSVQNSPVVDKIEDARFPNFNKAQPVGHILLKQKPLKIGHFRARPETALGAGGRAFKSPRPDQTVGDFKRVT
jgi:hypothetical protein